MELAGDGEGGPQRKATLITKEGRKRYCWPPQWMSISGTGKHLVDLVLLLGLFPWADFIWGTGGKKSRDSREMAPQAILMVWNRLWDYLRTLGLHRECQAGELAL